jgi:hypothetical protein
MDKNKCPKKCPKKMFVKTPSKPMWQWHKFLLLYMVWRIRSFVSKVTACFKTPEIQTFI